jgi:hypothetical protein
MVRIHFTPHAKTGTKELYTKELYTKELYTKELHLQRP